MLKPAQSPGLADERAQVYAELEKGADATKVARKLAAKYPEEESIVSFVDTVLAEVWLDSGAPFRDVLTVLEVRHRFDLPTGACRAYAVGILVGYALSCADNSDPISDPKEAHYAVACDRSEPPLCIRNGPRGRDDSPADQPICRVHEHHRR